MRLRVGARTDTGRVRPQNEDAYMSRAEEGLFVVCDGMGGAPAGEVASELAIQAIARQLTDDHRNGSTPGSSPFMPHTTRLLDAVRQSNEFIYGQAQKDPRQAGMGTTVVGAWIREQIAGVAHVGDSRAYLWHNDRLEPLTRDHSLIEAHLEAGLVDEGLRLSVEQQNVLVRCTGPRTCGRRGRHGSAAAVGGLRAALQRWPDPHGSGDGAGEGDTDVSGAAADLRPPDCSCQRERRRRQHHRGGGGSHRRMVAPVHKWGRGSFEEDTPAAFASEARTRCRN